jgi:hypothetical protein
MNSFGFLGIGVFVPCFDNSYCRFLLSLEIGRWIREIGNIIKNFENMRDWRVGRAVD